MYIYTKLSYTIYANVKINIYQKTLLGERKKHSQMQNGDEEVDCIFNKVAIKIDRKIIIFQQFKLGKEYL